MKTINVTLTESEYEELVKQKEELGLSWHDFILTITQGGDQYEN